MKLGKNNACDPFKIKTNSNYDDKKISLFRGPFFFSLEGHVTKTALNIRDEQCSLNRNIDIHNINHATHYRNYNCVENDPKYRRLFVPLASMKVIARRK